MVLEFMHDQNRLPQHKEIFSLSKFIVERGIFVFPFCVYYRKKL